MHHPHLAATAANGTGEDHQVVFTGDGLTDFWSYTQARDYLLLMPGMTHPALRLYLILRSMVANNKRRSSRLRKMTIDQLCWLMSGSKEGEKPISISSMYEHLALLEKLDLVAPRGDFEELAGARKVKDRKKRAATTMLRGWVVKDLPPVEYTGWRNAWDKLDAYSPDWRESPPSPPAYATVYGTDEDGRPTVEVRLTAGAPTRGDEVFQNSGTPPAEAPEKPVFQFSGTVFQKTGTPFQKTGTDLQLTSKNEGSLKSLPNKPLSLSGDSSVTPSPSKEETGEREKKAATDEPAAIPEQRPSAGAESVVQAYVAAASAAGVVTDHRDITGIRRDAAALLAEVPDCTPEWLAQRAAEMPAHRWSDLRRHVAKCKTPMRAPKKAARSKPCSKCMGSGLMEDENGFPIGKCDCRTATVPA